MLTSPIFLILSLFLVASALALSGGISVNSTTAVPVTSTGPSSTSNSSLTSVPTTIPISGSTSTGVTTDLSVTSSSTTPTGLTTSSTSSGLPNSPISSPPPTTARSEVITEAQFTFTLKSCVQPGSAELTAVRTFFAMIADLSENFIVIVAPSQCPSLLRQSEAIYLAKITDPDPIAGNDALVYAQTIVSAINSGPLNGAPTILQTGPLSATDPTVISNKSLALLCTTTIGLIFTCVILCFLL